MLATRPSADVDEIAGDLEAIRSTAQARPHRIAGMSASAEVATGRRVARPRRSGEERRGAERRLGDRTRHGGSEREARRGAIDPVFAATANQADVHILARRRKNNPIVVGEPGVGKTAVVEGLALRIVEGDVPETLRNVRLLSLDLGLLQAGAGVKGEFENRLKQVIAEIKGSPTPIVTFIDEAHTLIGAGGSAGTSDAANLLKPALARGELRTIAATTWTEYKKYFEKDAALERRFQLVKLDEPSVDDTIVMMRGLRETYEAAHGIRILDEAVIAAAQLSSRYISGRQLPDKAVDVLDTACARVRIGRATKPEAVDDRERRLAALGARRARSKATLRSVWRTDPERRRELVAEMSGSRRRRGNSWGGGSANARRSRRCSSCAASSRARRPRRHERWERDRRGDGAAAPVATTRPVRPRRRPDNRAPPLPRGDRGSPSAGSARSRAPRQVRCALRDHLVGPG